VNKIAAIILAAGRSTRFGQDRVATKAVAEFDGAPLVCRVAKAALASRASPVLVVTGHAGNLIAVALKDYDVRVVYAPDYAVGLSRSLRAGVAAVPDDARGAIVLLADMPLIAPALIDALIATFDAVPNAKAVVPTYAGRRGNPVLLGRALFTKIARLEGDRGAGQILAEMEGVVECPGTDESIFADVDTPDDLRQLADSSRATAG
jgi:molybdenum cofactor cytidylyltransferase